MQPFLNYNFAGGTYITSAPIITADWKADSGQRWTVPLGVGVGKIFHFGKLPVNTQIGALLQRRASGQRRELAAASPGPVHVSEVAMSIRAW